MWLRFQILHIIAVKCIDLYVFFGFGIDREREVMNVWDVILAAAVICVVVFAVSKAIKRRGRCAGCDGSCAGCSMCDTEEKRRAWMPKSAVSPDGEKPAAKEEETK